MSVYKLIPQKCKNLTLQWAPQSLDLCPIENICNLSQKRFIKMKRLTKWKIAAVESDHPRMGASSENIPPKPLQGNDQLPHKGFGDKWGKNPVLNQMNNKISIQKKSKQQHLFVSKNTKTQHSAILH